MKIKLKTAKHVEMDSFRGLYVLDAAEPGHQKIDTGDPYDGVEDAGYLLFRLDGIVYMAIEDPQDDYRSSMRALIEVPNAKMKNVFSPHAVYPRFIDDAEGRILEFVDLVTQLPVIEVGTHASDSYYPSFRGEFLLENLEMNRAKKT